MSNLRLADEVLKAAEYFSLHEDTDVKVVLQDGSASLYVKGKDESPIWWASPMPQVEQGQSVSYLDLTPSMVHLGRWLPEAETFVAARSLNVRQFLELYRSGKARK